MNEPEQRLDAAALIEAAADAGYQVTLRLLELWRYRGLLPRAERQPGGRAIWLYPLHAERQLLRLLHWRERTRYHDEILVALWVEGFEIGIGRVRDALVCFVRRWAGMVERELRRAPTATEAVDLLAHRFARMRGNAPFPHRSRMSLAQRERAYGYMVAMMLGNEEELERREADLPHLERIVGLRRGHDGGLAPLLGLRDEQGRVPRMPRHDEARSAIEAASDDELEFARRAVRAVFALMPVALPMLAADYPAKALEVVELIEDFLADMSPGPFAFAVALTLVLLGQRKGSPEGLREHLKALEPTTVSEELARMEAAAAAKPEG